jgi:type II secretory pathway pseudopilin PulG
MLLITVMMIAMTIEAPRIVQQIKREKEEELIHRGQEYAIAIRKFYRKNGTYPVSLDQLESTNNQRFLRKRWKDPFTNGEWKLVHVGEAQAPLLPNTPSAVAPGAPGSPGAPGQSGSLNTSSNPFASTPTPSPAPGGFGTSPGGGLNPGGGQQGNPPGTGQIGTLQVQTLGGSGGGGPVIGVASTSKKTSIKVFNENTEYDQWLFVYDPHFEVPGRNGVLVASPVGAGGPTGALVGAQTGPIPPQTGANPGPAPSPSGGMPVMSH